MIKREEMFELMEKQRELDNYILETKKIDLHPLELMANRCLAFQVEVAELANEVRSFKHWSNKPRSEHEVILEEFADGLHFLLSISYTVADYGEGISYDTWVFNPDSAECGASNLEINSRFLATSQIVSELYFEWGTDRDEFALFDILAELWSSYSFLAAHLGLSEASVIGAYERKYQINIERQKAGY